MNKRITRIILCLLTISIISSTSLVSAALSTYEWHEEVVANKSYYWKIIDYTYVSIPLQVESLEIGGRIEVKSTLSDLTTQFEIFDYIAVITVANVSLQLPSYNMSHLIMVLEIGYAPYFVIPLKEDGTNYIKDLENTLKSTPGGTFEKTKTTMSLDLTRDFYGGSELTSRVVYDIKTGFLLEYRASKIGAEGFTFEIKDQNNIVHTSFGYFIGLFSLLIFTICYIKRRKRE